jgi:streptogramin lyase
MKCRSLAIAVVVAQSISFFVLDASPASASGTYAVTDYPLIDGMRSAGAITFGPDGNVWTTECNGIGCDGSGIASVSPSGTMTNYPVSGTNGWGPGGITTGPDGALWFTQAGPNGYIGRITTSGQVSYPSPTISYPGDITTGPDGNLWITTDGHPRTIPHSRLGHLPEPQAR